MSLSPEARTRIVAIEQMAEDLRDVPPNSPKIHDFVRNGKGAGDILWLISQLKKAHETTDDAPEKTSEGGGLISYQEIPGDSRQADILSQVRTLVGAENDDEVIDKVAALVVPSDREIPAGHGLEFGTPSQNDDDFDDDDEFYDEEEYDDEL